MSTIEYAKQGLFKLIPDSIVKTPELAPWLNGGRIVVAAVLIIGFIQAYKTIKDKYLIEMQSNQISIRK
jgi:hypothetical protein